MITANYRYYLPPEQVNASKHFGTDSVAVTLEWVPAEKVTYNVSIVPQEELPLELNTSSRWQLTVNYNVSYTVSIHSEFCGYSNTTTLMLKYGECFYTASCCMKLYIHLHAYYYAGPDFLNMPLYIHNIQKLLFMRCSTPSCLCMHWYN